MTFTVAKYLWLLRGFFHIVIIYINHKYLVTLRKRNWYRLEEKALSPGFRSVHVSAQVETFYSAQAHEFFHYQPPWFTPAETSPLTIWPDHFSWNTNRLRIVGLTPTGRATVAHLDLNDDRHDGDVIRIRHFNPTTAAWVELAHQATIAKGTRFSAGVCPKLTPLKARLGRKWSQL